MATPTFWTEYLANTDIISGASSTKTQIANVTAAWGDATKANVDAAADCVWPARSDIWTGASFTIVVVAQPIDVYDNSDPYTVFTLVSSTSHILEVAFFGNHQSGTVGTDALNVYAYQGGAYRVGFAADNQCDGNAHTWVIRFNNGTMHCWRDGVAQTITPTNVNAITKDGTVTPHLNSDGLGIGHINRNAPVGLVKFFNSALSDVDVAAESADPWYSAGGSTDATADGVTLTGTATLTPGTATGGSGAVDATAAGVTLTGTATLTPGTATGGASGSFVSSPMYSSGILQASVAADWTWYPGAIGAAPTAALVHGSGATAGDGTLTAAGLAAGSGFLLAETADGSIYYEAGTVA